MPRGSAAFLRLKDDRWFEFVDVAQADKGREEGDGKHRHAGEEVELPCEGEGELGAVDKESKEGGNAGADTPSYRADKEDLSENRKGVVAS